LSNKDPTVRGLARGWTMSLIALSAVATTVHLWNVPYSYFFFFLGAAGWLADPAKVRATAKKMAPAKKTPAPYRYPEPTPMPGGYVPAPAY